MFYLFISTNNSRQNLCCISILALCCLDFFTITTKSFYLYSEEAPLSHFVHLNFNAPSALRINQYRKILKILFYVTLIS